MGAVTREQWNRLVVPGQGPISHTFLSAWEHVILPGLQSRPLVAWDDEGQVPVAATPACFYDLDPGGLKAGAPPLPLRALRRLREDLLLLRIYELGAPAALAFPLLHEAGMSAADAARLLLPAAMDEAARAGAHVMVVQDFVAGEDGFDEVLEEAGFVPVPVLPTVMLELPFDSFDDYLAAMRAPYRRRAHRALEQSRELRVEHHHMFAPLAPELARLTRAVFDRAGEIRREILSEDYFRAASAAPDMSLLALRRSNGTIACFALLLDDGPCLQFLNCGFELTAREDGAYFRLLYELVRLGIEKRYHRLNLGITTVPPKLDIGGVPVPLVAWIRYHRTPVQSLCAAVARRVLHHEVESPRRVFKTPPATDSAAVVVHPAAARLRRSA